jgi:hypothetical protein
VSWHPGPLQNFSYCGPSSLALKLVLFNFYVGREGTTRWHFSQA